MREVKFSPSDLVQKSSYTHGLTPYTAEAVCTIYLSEKQLGRVISEEQNKREPSKVTYS